MQFTKDNCKYRNGKKPIAVYFIEEAEPRCFQRLISVAENGVVCQHQDNGAYLKNGESGRDLIPLPTSRRWEKEDDVPDGIERLRIKNGSTHFVFLSKEGEGVRILNCNADRCWPHLESWKSLAEWGYEYRLAGSTEWKPCEVKEST